METEIWKDIEGFNGRYKASNTGKIKSVKKNKEIVLKTCLNLKGYKQVCLYSNNKKINSLVSRLVAFTFLDVKDKKLFVDHIDGNTQNNNVSNLRFASNYFNCTIGFRKDRNTKTSVYPGVSFQKRNKKWRAQLRINKISVLSKEYKTEIEAHNAYQEKVLEYCNIKVSE